MKNLISLLIITLIAVSAPATAIYVDVNGSGLCATIQTASTPPITGLA